MDTIKELIEKLKEFDENTKIRVEYEANYFPITSIEKGDEDDKEEGQEIVIINCW